MPELRDYDVIVKFGKGIPGAAQGVTMMAFEKHLREIGAGPCEVFKETMSDDSKLRVQMTAAERAKL